MEISLFFYFMTGKYIVLLLSPLIFWANTISVAATAKRHPIHVSVVEINHNTKDKTLEISCKIFTDDFEEVLNKLCKCKINLLKPDNKKQVEQVIEKYINQNFRLLVNDKPAKFSMIGYENDPEATHCYFEVSDVLTLKKISVTNSLVYDLFTDQINIIHLYAGKTTKSTKLEYPATQYAFSF